MKSNSLELMPLRPENKASFRKAIYAWKNKPDLMTIKVNSSLNAGIIYEKLGFRKIDTEQIFKGIRFIPMSLNFQNFIISEAVLL